MPNPDLTRRSFTKGLIVALALPHLFLRAFAQTPLSRPLRFSVFSLFEPQRLTVQSSEPLLLRVDDQPPRVLALNAEPLTICTILGSSLEIPSQRVTGQTLTFTSLSAGPATFTLGVPPPALHGTIRRTYQAVLEIKSSRRSLISIVSIDAEAALVRILHAESPQNASPTYLRAQAIVSRSFLRSAATTHRGFDFCDTTHCQFLGDAPPPNSSIHEAIHSSQGVLLTFDGEPFPAMYSRSCGGRTHTLSELGLPVASYPYYAVDCPFCRHHPETWRRTLASAPHTERDRLGHNRIFGWSALPSNTFTSTGATLEGRGIGHGIGLCQRGAAALAASGLTTRQILAHYYPNTGLSA